MALNVIPHISDSYLYYPDNNLIKIPKDKPRNGARSTWMIIDLVPTIMIGSLFDAPSIDENTHF